MKQKIIIVVLLAAAMYLPVGSKECGKSISCPQAQAKIKTEKAAEITEELSSFPASPFSRSLLNL